MKKFGSWRELVSAIFRKDTFAITLRPNQTTTYTADRDIQLPQADSTQVMVGRTSADQGANRLQNKDLSDDSVLFVDQTDTTKKVAIEVSGVTTGTTRTLTIPDTNITIAGRANTETLQNKTLDNTNTATLKDTLFTIQDDVDTTKQIRLQASSITTGTTRTLTSPDTDITIAGRTNTETLQNKTLDTTNTATLKGTLFTITDATDITAQARFSAGSIPTATTRTLTVPNANTTLVGTDTAQTLTNKTLTGAVVSDFLELDHQASDPAAPAGNDTRLYAKTKKLFLRTADAISEVGASGSGEINVIDNPSDANAGWVASGAGVTVATTTTSTDLPLAGIVESAIKITPVTAAAYVRYRWTQPEALKQRKLKVEWHQRPLTGYASGDLKIEVWKNSTSDYLGTYTEFSLSTDSSGTSSIPNQTGKYTTTFDTDDASFYELRIVVVSGTTALNITNVIAGPGIQPQGAVVTPIDSYTPTTQGFGTLASVLFYYSRAGEKIRVQGRFTSGTVTASEARIHLPTGLTVGTLGNTVIVGRWYRHNATASTTRSGALSSTSGLAYVNAGNEDPANAISPFSASNGSALFNSSEIISFEFEVPVSEWSGSGTVNLAQNDVEYAYNSSTTDADDTTSFAYGPGGGRFPGATTNRSKRVRFQTPIRPTDKLILEVSNDSGATWVSPTISNFIQSFSIQNTVDYGMRIDFVNSTDVDAYFAQYKRSSGATFGSAGEAWTSIDADPVYKWRISKIAGGQAVGFGTVSETSSGLMPASHANLDNATATRLGFKAYYHGTTYSGGIAPTVTSSIGTLVVTRALFIPYQMQDSTWRLRMNVACTHASSAGGSFTINGVTFKSGTGFEQALAARQPPGTVVHDTYAQPGLSTVFSNKESAQTLTNFSGDVELDAKPTWAY